MSKINLTNLLSNSFSNNLLNAAKEWYLELYGETNSEISCELCGTRIKNYYRIKNKETASTLTVGGVCFDHLLKYFRANKITSGLISRKEFLKERENVFAHHIWKSYRECEDIVDPGSWMTWMISQLDNAPADLCNIIRLLKKMKFLDSEDEKQKLIDYHDSVRKFRREVLLPHWKEYVPCPPEYITIQQARHFIETKGTEPVKESPMSDIDKESNEIIKGINSHTAAMKDIFNRKRLTIDDVSAETRRKWAERKKELEKERAQRVSLILSSDDKSLKD